MRDRYQGVVRSVGNGICLQDLTVDLDGAIERGKLITHLTYMMDIIWLAVSGYSPTVM
jgi:hypothetical protein